MNNLPTQWETCVVKLDDKVYSLVGQYIGLLYQVVSIRFPRALTLPGQLTSDLSVIGRLGTGRGATWRLALRLSLV